jgi:YD repeat-containing protein
MRCPAASRRLAPAAALALCFAPAFAQPKVCELSVKGPVESVTTVYRAASGEAQSSETVHFDRDGRLLRRITRNPVLGDRTTVCQYEKGHVVRAVTDAEEPKKRSVVEMKYSPDGLLLEADQRDATGRVTARTLSDSLRETPPAIERSFRFQLSGPAELNDRTVIDDNDENTTITHLMVDGEEEASWRIERDSKGRVVRDEVMYADLSFSQREFHKDGSSVEHQFYADNGSHNFLWRDARGELVHLQRLTAHDNSDTTYTYDDLGRLKSAETRGASRKEEEYEYVNDDFGNWIKQTKIVDHNLSAITQRSISYRSP